MLYPDNETLRQLVRERQEALKRDALRAEDLRPRALATGRRRKRLQLGRLRLGLRPAGDPS